jgi:hypothetical protein
LIRQSWVFLTDADEADLVARLSSTAPLRCLPGRFFKGTEADLRARPEALETAQLRANERWVHLLHPLASQSLVAHPVEEGPFAGWMRLDETRSEVLTIVRPLPGPQGLAPARLQAATHAWFGGEKLRKSGTFSAWAGQALKLVEAFPPTALEWIRCAPDARRWSEGGGRLHYLYRDVALAPR